MQSEDDTTLQLYRYSALGDALQEALHEMGASVSPELSAKVFKHFDHAYGELLSQKIASRAMLRATIDSYNFVEDVMKLRLKNVELVITQSASKAKNVPRVTLRADDMTLVGVQMERRA